MKMAVGRHSIKIFPENDVDIAYLEDVLGMNTDEATAKAKVDRVTFSSYSPLAYIEIRKADG